MERNNSEMAQFATDLENLERYLTLSDKMVQTVSAIRGYYVDEIKLDTIYDRVIPKLLSELDPHSEFIPAKDFKSVNESLEGEFDGIGIVFNASTDTIMVLSVIPQGPSDKAGLREQPERAAVAGFRAVKTMDQLKKRPFSDIIKENGCDFCSYEENSYLLFVLNFDR
jgi:carboxyl-terminal processing protease